MGIIFSKLKEYINTKIDNTKRRIRNKIDDVKQGINNRIINTKDAINNKINQVITSCKNCIRSTKEDIVGAIVGVKDRICGRIARTKNNICDKCFMIKSNIFGKINDAKDSVISTKNRITSRVGRGKNNVVKKYVNVTNNVHHKYRRIRNAKLTKCQKVYYSVLSILVLCILYVLIATSFNLYTNDYDQIEARFTAISEGSKLVAKFLFDLTSIILIHVWQLTHYTCHHLWNFSTIAWTHISECLSIAKHHLHEKSKEAVLFVGWTSKEVAIFVWWCIGQACHYIAIGSVALGDYFWMGSLVVADHLKHYAGMGFHYSYEGSKVAFHFAKEGLTCAYHQSSLALQEYGPQLIDYVVYFATDFRHASIEAAGLMSEFLQVSFAWSCSTLYQTLLLCCDLSLKTLTISYYSFLDLVQWAYDQSLTSADTFCYYSVQAARWSYRFSIDAYIFMENFLILSYHTAIEESINLYDKSISTSYHLMNWLSSTAETIASWCIYLYDILYAFVTDHGLVWASKLCHLLLEGFSMFLRILLKFFGDLGGFVFNFISVTTERIYTVTYFVVSVFYVIITTAMAVVRFVLSWLVWFMKGLFGATIGSLVFVGKSYAAFLERYNSYREIVFFTFISILANYCMGIARDRNESHKMHALKRVGIELDQGDGSEVGLAIEDETMSLEEASLSEEGASEDIKPN